LFLGAEVLPGRAGFTAKVPVLKEPEEGLEVLPATWVPWSRLKGKLKKFSWKNKIRIFSLVERRSGGLVESRREGAGDRGPESGAAQFTPVLGGRGGGGEGLDCNVVGGVDLFIALVLGGGGGGGDWGGSQGGGQLHRFEGGASKGGRLVSPEVQKINLLIF